MVTEHDKAIVALIMAAITLAGSYGLLHVDAQTMTAISAVITPVVVWLVPNNKPVDPAIQQAGGR